MAYFLLRRLVQMPATLLLVSVVVFGLTHITPGDPVAFMLGDQSTESDRELLRHRMGFDKPLYEQYFHWMGDVLRGEFGTSVYSGLSVRELLLDRAPYTLTLTLLAMFFAIAVSLPLGIIAARHHNRFLDYLLMIFSLLGMAMPSFVVGLLLILVLAVNLDLLPISGPGDPFHDPVGSLRYYVMPVIALGLVRVAQLTRIVRSSILETQGRDYIRTARAKGLGERQILLRHTLKNALIPVITVFALAFATTLGGTVVIESIFSIPGVGQLMLDAILQRDFPLVQGITVVMALIFIVANLVADILYGLVDPRIKFN